MNTTSLTLRSPARRTRRGKAPCYFEPLEDRQLLTADLTATFAGALPPVMNGGREQVALNVSNVGTTNANGAVRIQLFLVPAGSTVATGAKPLRTVRRSVHLSAGGTQTMNVSVPISAATAAGNYQLVAVVNPNRGMRDVDSSNNATNSDTFGITQSNVDLTSSVALVRTPTLVEGRPTTGVARVTVTNTALSTDTTPANTRSTFDIVARPLGAVDDSSDIVLGSGAIQAGNLAPGASRTVTVPLHFPTTLTAGQMNLMVEGDTGNALVETDELNNDGFLPTPLTVMPVGTAVPPGAGSGITGGATPITGPIFTTPGNFPITSTSPSIVTLTPTILPTPTNTLNQPFNESPTLVASQFPVPASLSLLPTSSSGLFPTNLNLFPTLSTPVTLGTQFPSLP